MHTTRIDLDPGDRSAVVALLNREVLLLTDLRVQTKLAHWNLRGPRFLTWHVFFDQLADHLDAAADVIAERAAALGGAAGAPVQVVAKETALPAWDLSTTEDESVLRELTARWAVVANSVRHAIDDAAQRHDADAADVLTEVSRQLDKDLWMLEASLG